MSDRYCIKAGYIIRAENDFDNEIGQTDTCQDEVYAAARRLLDKHKLQSVLDIGTGSGFKLMKYFSDKRTLGIDLPPTIAWVKTKYPERAWSVVPFDILQSGFDLIIAADIIEHLVDPDEMLNFIRGCKPKFVVISTPNRDNLAEHSWDGPPRNLCHVREWSSAEFADYITKSGFEILEHVYPDASRRDYSTMYVVARVK